MLWQSAAETKAHRCNVNRITKTPSQKTLRNDWMTYLLLHYGNMSNAAFSLGLVAVPGQQLSFSYTQNTLGVLSGARWSKHLSHLCLGLAVGAVISLHHVTPGTDGCQLLSVQRNYGYSLSKHAVCFALLNSRGGDGGVLFQLDSPS